MHRKNSDACKSLILAAFGVDMASESKEVYPQLVCNNCYLSMKRIQKSKETGVTMKSNLSLSSWLPHSESCPVCTSDPISERHKKFVGSGRPRNDDICHLSREVMRAVNTINPPEYNKLPLKSTYFLPTHILPSVLCQHCSHIPNRPLELLPCHHLICISCIARITETQVLTCSCSSVECQVIEPHPLVIRVLDTLLLNCPGECGQIVPLKNLQQHQHVECARISQPPLSLLTMQQVIDSPQNSAVVEYCMGVLVEKFIPTAGSASFRSPSTGKVNNVWPLK